MSPSPTDLRSVPGEGRKLQSPATIHGAIRSRFRAAQLHADGLAAAGQLDGDGAVGCSAADGGGQGRGRRLRPMRHQHADELHRPARLQRLLGEDREGKTGRLPAGPEPPRSARRRCGPATGRTTPAIPRGRGHYTNLGPLRAWHAGAKAGPACQPSAAGAGLRLGRRPPAAPPRNSTIRRQSRVSAVNQSRARNWPYWSPPRALDARRGDFRPQRPQHHVEIGRATDRPGKSANCSSPPRPPRSSRRT